MKREFNIDTDKVKQLEVGMVFKNMDDLSVFVGMPVGSKTGYELLLKEFILLKNGVEIERKGHKIIITNIR